MKLGDEGGWEDLVPGGKKMEARAIGPPNGEVKDKDAAKRSKRKAGSRHEKAEEGVGHEEKADVSTERPERRRSKRGKR